MNFKRTLNRFSRFVHKWIALIVIVQAIAWTLGGLIFVSMPFKSVIHGEDYIKSQAKNTNDTNMYPLYRLISKLKNVESVSIVTIGSQRYYKVIFGKNQMRLFNINNGKIISKPNKNQITKYAKNLYNGDASISNVKYIAKDNDPDKRLIIVDEIYGKRGVWQVTFDDFLNTRLYFEAASGEFYKIRNDAWVIYDFFWRLHVMDYSNGEDFNHPLIIVFALLFFILVFSGSIMMFFTKFFRKKRIKPQL